MGNSVGENIDHATNGIPSVPPGFSSFKSFTLKRVQENGTAAANASYTVQCTIQDEQSKTSFQYQPWMNYHLNNSSDEKSDYKLFDQLTARWRPKNAQNLILDEAPVFYPSEEEFKNTLEYIASIRTKAESYGICRIVPPSSWKPPCLLKEKNVFENSKFTARIQQLDRLQTSVSKFKQNRYTTSTKRQKLLQETDNSDENTVEVNQHRYLNNFRRFGFETGPEFTLKSFQKYADEFKDQYFQTNAEVNMACGRLEPSVHNIESEYWRIIERPTEEIELSSKLGMINIHVQLEGGVLEKLCRIISLTWDNYHQLVLCGADLDTRVFGSGFLKASASLQKFEFDNQHLNCGWNLNNLAQLPGSMLSFESGDIPGVVVPWLYVGMCFSSFCWHVENHHLYSLNYLHCGAPKIWYGVPGKDASMMEEAMKKHLPDLFDKQPDLLQSPVTQFSPSLLRLEGVPVYRCVQNSGEFVLTFPHAYHSGFSCGFNCAEAVNVAPLDWLPHGQNAVELYGEQGRKISISHDKLLLSAAKEAVRFQWNLSLLRAMNSDKAALKNFCGSDGVLAKALEVRIEMERIRREYFCSSKSRKMDPGFDGNSERECAICHYDLHLSAVSCPCSLDKFACLIHAKNLCLCAWTTRSFLFRYDISELNVLLDALRGKLSAVHKWGISDLGLSLSSYVSKEKTGKSKFVMVSEERREHKDNEEEPCFRMDEDFHSTDHKISSMTTSSHSGQQLEGNNSPGKNADIISTPSSHNDNSASCNLDIDDQIEESKDCCRVPSSFPPQQVDDLFLVKPIECSEFPITDSVAEPSEDILPAKEASKCVSESTYHKVPLHSECGKANDGSKDGESELNPKCGLLDRRITKVNSFCAERNLNRYDHQQELPRLTMQHLQMINSNVQVLEYGTVLSGKLWSISQAIFPKGYKSRVKYLSVLDPTQMSFYISAILDAGLLGPLFMVMLEQCPSEVFIHVSATKCWDMVRARVNDEIEKQHNLGRLDLPPLQPPVDGLEMFGLLSPKVIQLQNYYSQAIEALDCNHVCTEYWRSRPQAPIPLDPVANATDQDPSSNKKQCSKETWDSAASKLAVMGLFKKANPEELHSLNSLLNNDHAGKSCQELIQILNDEIKSRFSR